MGVRQSSRYKSVTYVASAVLVFVLGCGALSNNPWRNQQAYDVTVALQTAAGLAAAGQVPVFPAQVAATVGDLKAVGGGDACSCASLLGSTESGSPLSLVGGAVDQVRRNLAAGRRLIVLMNYTARNTIHFGQQGATYVQERMLAALFGCSAQVMDFWEPQPGSPEFGSLTSALAEAALVVVNAEGTLHHRHTLLHPSLELAARHGADVPLWIINSSFQYNLSAPVHGTLGFFRDAAYAALRDGMSYAAVRSALPWARHLTLSADLTVLLPHRFTSDVEKQLAARVPARKSRDVSQGTPLRIVLSASALHMAAYASFWRELIPLVLAYHPNSTFILALDCNRKLSSEPWARFPGKYPGANFEGLCEYETLAEVLWTLRCADVFIGGRFHAATYALLAGLPAVLLPSNTWKVEAWAALVSSPGVDYVPAGPAAGAEQVWQRAQGVMAQREQLGHRGLAGLRQLALHNFPLSEPVQVASRVTAEELRMQRSWLAQTANKRRRSTFCERFGGRIKDGKSPTRRSLS